MQEMRRGAVVFLCMLLCIGLFTGCGGSSSTADTDSVQEEKVHAVIQWAEGGGTDSLMRPLIELADAGLDASIETENQVGLAGAIGFQYVYSQPADGSFLLMGAENPALYKALGYLDQTYEDFDCLCLIGSETVGVAVAEDSPYQSFTEIVDAALAGKEVVLSSTNVGGMPWTLSAMVQKLTGATFVQQWYAGDREAKDAVINGEVDFSFCKLQTGLPEQEAGKLRYLNVIAAEPVEQMEDVPLIIEEYPDFAQYLPWGPFYGVFVKKGTPQETKDMLRDAFQEAYADDSYQQLLTEAHINPLGLEGDEAAEYIRQWQEKTVDILSGMEQNQSFRFQVEE